MAREGELVQLDGSPYDWLEGRGPFLAVLGMQDDATGKILAAQFFLAETSEGYFHLLQSLLRCFGVPTAFYRDRSGTSCLTMIIGPWKKNWRASPS